LLSLLHKAKRGGQPAPNGSVVEYAELRSAGFIHEMGALRLINLEGEKALRVRFLRL
jgi:hypothetical protein